MIADFKERVKLYYQRHERLIFLVFCLILVIGIGYNIGRAYSNNKGGSQQSILSAGTPTTSKKPAITATPKDPRVVVSKAAKSMLYHYVWCSGAKNIKEENELWFGSASAAETAGYTLAANCTP